MKILFTKPNTIDTMYLPVIGISIFTCICQTDVYNLNGVYHTSLFDVLTLQFNLYSYVHLLFLPVYILAACRILKTSKFDDFIITRTDNRWLYFVFREKTALKFTIVYRAIEIFVSTIIFFMASIFRSGFVSNIVFFSPVVQSILCIKSLSVIESVIFFSFSQMLITLFYLIFSQIIILSDMNISNPFISTSIPIIVDFVLLALIKSNYIFRDTFLYYILPHNNINFEFLFQDYSANYLYASIRSLVYWLLLLTILLRFVLARIKLKDFLYPAKNVDYERE